MSLVLDSGITMKQDLIGKEVENGLGKSETQWSIINNYFTTKTFFGSKVIVSQINQLIEIFLVVNQCLKIFHVFVFIGDVLLLVLQTRRDVSFGIKKIPGKGNFQPNYWTPFCPLLVLGLPAISRTIHICKNVSISVVKWKMENDISY